MRLGDGGGEGAVPPEKGVLSLVSGLAPPGGARPSHDLPPPRPASAFRYIPAPRFDLSHSVISP